MSTLMLNNTEDIPNESYRLLSVLTAMEQELETPYIERRLKNISQKSDPLEELQEAINSINQRENDLQASIGIAKVLIESNDSLLQKNNTLNLKLLEKQNDIKLLSEEILRLKEELEMSEEKYKEINSLLAKTESEYVKALTELKKPEDYSNRIQEKSAMVSIEQYESDINELTIKYQKDHEYILRLKLEAEKKNKVNQEKIEETLNHINSLETQIEDYRKKLKVSEKHLKKTEEFLTQEKLEKKEIEEKFDELYEKHKELLEISEKQAEEIEILNMPKTMSSPTHKRDHASLQIELEGLDEYEGQVQAMFENPGRTSFNFNGVDLKKSFKAMPRTLGVFKQGYVQVASRFIIKNPYEQYFMLASQACKLNSVYIDSICTVPPKVLYESALKQGIPFHKWHVWIEKELNGAYLKNIYKKVPRSR